MAQPGWYADPTAPDGRRYWDGQRWVDPTPPRKGRAGWVWLSVALVVVAALVAALLIFPSRANPFAPTPEDTRTARPTGKQWDERVPSETPTPTEIESQFGESIDCPSSEDWPRSELTDGRLEGGGLSVDAPQGEKWRMSPAHIDWMYDGNSMLREIVFGWISNVNVGYIKVSDGFSANPRAAAEQFVNCMASSGMFLGFTRRTVLWNEEWDVSGRPAWRLTSNVYVDDWSHEGIEGDTVDIIIVPTDDKDRLAVYVSCVTIGHEENISEVEPVLESLAYEG
ncbi:DUF2510 domain-containing protein [Tessaracoccus sp. ZS01]|uniref:DUF2510 domain-containing protein n=1 Tax=Tessaracoccus sp. ZS01 TaxID=1906324 RepID=UPI0013019963|nr:DUF2510 domain-containing protein [Tessaracoccus sp. ZS01]